MKKTFKKMLGRLGLGSKEAVTQPSKQEKADIIFIHIGKNAGTQIVNLSKQILDMSGTNIQKVKHDVRLSQIDPELPYFFSIRNPVGRFKSAFYSRKRKGQPRVYSEWSEHEAIAFSEFEHANDLAESLFSKGERGASAMAAMQSISHTTMHQIDWFAKEGYFLKARPPIWIIRQENFREDFDTLLEKANLNLKMSDLEIANDEKQAHKNDYSQVPALSAKAKDNLALWYSRDFEFVEKCEQWMRDNA